MGFRLRKALVKSIFLTLALPAVASAGVMNPSPEGEASVSLLSINPNCAHTAPNMVDCDLLPLEYTGGQISEIGIPPSTTVRFTNRTGQYVQINQITAETNETSYWSEYCAFRNDYFTGQRGAPGIGEVGCTTKNPGEAYPPLQWDGIATALSVAPGDQIYIGSHTEPASINHTFKVVSYLQSTGIYAYRAPKIDQVITCNGSTQSSAWTPWVNNTGGVLHLTGASIYAVSGNSPGTDQVDAACIYILDTAGAVRFSHCNQGVERRGLANFPTQLIYPGESLVGHASNQCPAGHLWDWAAYMYVW